MLEEEINVGSALLLLDFGQVSFYREQATTFTALRGAQVDGQGALRDLIVSEDGSIAELMVESNGGIRRVPFQGVSF